MATTTKTKSATSKKAPTSKAKSAATSAKAKSPARAPKVKPKKSAAEELRELFIDGLKDIYWAEKALVEALPKMAKNATTTKLVSGLNDHLEQTKHHVDRLEDVFELLGEKAVAKKCDAMDGLINEGNGILEETQPGPVRDAGIIAACQKIEHYEIATYGTLCAYAKTLFEDKAGAVLHQTLEEEKAADLALTEAAYNDINFHAK